MGKPKGWFSRRHETNEAHLAASAAKAARVDAQLEATQARLVEASARSPWQQLERLDLGGYRAKKERAKLKRRIEALERRRPKRRPRSTEG